MTSDKKQEKPKLPLKREFSAGGCVFKKVKSQPVRQAQGKQSKVKIVWLLGKHSGYHKWVLPKGMIEPGEKGIETAVRETKEEMGVVAKVVGTKPIHKDEYFFVAELKSNKVQETSDKKEPSRRVKTYQEDPSFSKSEVQKVRIFKTVTFYLMEYVEGDPKDHDWEMEDAGWYSYKDAIGLMAFEGEKVALRQAQGKLMELFRSV